MSCAKRKKLARRAALKSEQATELPSTTPDYIVDIEPTSDEPLSLRPEIEPEMIPGNAPVTSLDAPGSAKEEGEAAKMVPGRPVVKKKSYKQK